MIGSSETTASFNAVKQNPSVGRAKEIIMGWGRTLLLGDVGNRLDISDCEREISSLRSSLRKKSGIDINQEEELRNLRLEVDELKLCLSSLTRILTAKRVVAEADLMRFAQAIDDDDVIEFLNEDP